MTMQVSNTRNFPRADFHQEFIDQKEAQEPKTWGQTFKNALPWFAGAAAIGSMAYGARKYQQAHSKPVAKLSEGTPAQQAAGLNAIKGVALKQQGLQIPDNGIINGPGGCIRLPWKDKPVQFNNPPSMLNPCHPIHGMPQIGDNLRGGGIGRAVAFMRPPENDFQKNFLKGQDALVDGAAAAGMGALAGAAFGPVGAVVGGLVAGIGFAIIGGEMRGR